MSIRQLTRSVLILMLLLAVAGGGYAQGPEGDVQPPTAGTDVESAKYQELEHSPLAVEADLGAGFYYQGVLTENGIPVSGSREMEFKLWDAASGGAQVGATLTPTVAVNKGQFSVELSWGSSAIDGRALWLGMRAKDAGGVWRDLGRRSILAVPYAMSLMPGANIIARGSTYGIYAFGASTDAIRAYTTSTSGGDGAIYARAVADSGSAKGGYFYSAKGIGVYGVSDTAEGLYGDAPNHDGVTGRSVVAGRSGVYGDSENGYGVSGSSDKTHGVWGRTQATTGAAHGVYGTSTSPSGVGVYGANSSSGVGVAGFKSGYSPADLSAWSWWPGGLFGGDDGVIGITKAPDGYALVGLSKATTGYGRGIFASCQSPSCWAGWFSSSGDGVRVSTPAGKTALAVLGGTKSGVVATDDGSRLLYSEEATEVWFADYGFAQLAEGLATIRIDPLFAQTVNLAQPYHVFLQAYGDAEIYVANRSADGFEVRLRDGDPAVEFSYRIVAKRAGYETDRLERAPWADDDPNLYPEKAGLSEDHRQAVPVDVPAP